MKNNYLTKERKQYYLDEFNANILPSTHKYWKLDDGIKDIILNINKNENIQTLLSKRTPNKRIIKNVYVDDGISYLHFAYTEKVKICLLTEIQSFFISSYNNEKCNCLYEYKKPKLLEPFESVSKADSKFKCITDKNYTNINSILIYLFSNNIETHNLFWLDLEKILSNIK